MSRVRALRKLGPAETLPAIPRETFNTIVDVHTLLSRKKLPFGKPPPVPLKGNTTVLVRNDSGSDVERFAVLGIDEPIVLPTDNENEFASNWALACVTPTTGDSDTAGHAGRFVVTAEPIANGKIGRAYYAGVCPVRIEIASGEDNPRFAEIIDGETTALQSSSSGSVAVLWSGAAASGEDWALIRFGAGARTNCLVHLVSAASGGGKYNAKIHFDQPSVSATGDLADADLGSLPASVDALAINLHEIGYSTHDLLEGDPQVTDLPGVVFGNVSDTGLPIVYVYAVGFGCDDESPESGGAALMPETFGAVGDGTTDDTEAWENMMINMEGQKLASEIFDAGFQGFTPAIYAKGKYKITKGGALNPEPSDVGISLEGVSLYSDSPHGAEIIYDNDSAVSDAVWGTPTGAVVTITSAGGNLPSIKAGGRVYVSGASDSDNDGWYGETGGTPTTSSITVTKEDGNPVAASSAAASIAAPLLDNKDLFAFSSIRNIDFLASNGTERLVYLESAGGGRVQDISFEHCWFFDGAVGVEVAGEHNTSELRFVHCRWRASAGQVGLYIHNGQSVNNVLDQPTFEVNDGGIGLLVEAGGELHFNQGNLIITAGGLMFKIADPTGLGYGSFNKTFRFNGIKPELLSTATAVSDAVWGTPTGSVVTITSAGGNLPIVATGEYFKVTDHSNSANNGWYLASGTPTTSSITATMTGTPAAASAEAVTVTRTARLFELSAPVQIELSGNFNKCDVDAPDHVWINRRGRILMHSATCLSPNLGFKLSTHGGADYGVYPRSASITIVDSELSGDIVDQVTWDVDPNADVLASYGTVKVDGCWRSNSATPVDVFLDCDPAAVAGHSSETATEHVYTFRVPATAGLPAPTTSGATEPTDIPLPSGCLVSRVVIHLEGGGSGTDTVAFAVKTAGGTTLADTGQIANNAEHVETQQVYHRVADADRKLVLAGTNPVASFNTNSHRGGYVKIWYS